MIRWDKVGRWGDFNDSGRQMGPQDGKGIVNVMIGNVPGDRNIACYIL